MPNLAHLVKVLLIGQKGSLSPTRNALCKSLSPKGALLGERVWAKLKPMKIGYARVSAEEQSLSLQKQA